MGLESIGKNIRKFRHHRELRQEDLAEATGLSINYIGAIERGEKIPALETFIDICNALSATSDMVLCDVLHEGYRTKDSKLEEQMENISAEDRKRIIDVVEVLLKQANYC